MTPPPRVSIVTPLPCGDDDPARAIDSVRAQGYGSVQHIVVTGGPGTGTRALAADARLTVVSAPGASRSAAIRAGFAAADGDILTVVDADAVLMPGAIERVAVELHPGRGRHVVAGRCRLLDEDGRFGGLEHPVRFEGRRRLLEVWRGHTLPVAGLFWTARAWAACGGVGDERTAPWADFEICCRLSAAHDVHVIDQVVAARRLPRERSQWRWAPGLDEAAIAQSRRHWGSPLGPRYWRLALSLAAFRLDRVGRARRHLRAAGVRGRSGRLVAAAPRLLAAAALAPEAVLWGFAYPRLLRGASRALRAARRRFGGRAPLAAETLTYLERTEPWSDGWVGPRLVARVEAPAGARALVLRGWADVEHMRAPLVLTVRLDDRVVGRHPVRATAAFEARLALPAALPAGSHSVTVEAGAWFVPDRHTGNGDVRPLSWRMNAVELDVAAP